MPTGDRKLDEFESLFRSAIKAVFRLARPPLTRVVVVTDVDAEHTDRIVRHAQRFLTSIDGAGTMEWNRLGQDAWILGEDDPLATLLHSLEELQPQLIVTARYLAGTRSDYALGSVVDSLTQATDTPVLLLPTGDLEQQLRGTSRVLVVTDHLQGDDALVNWGVKMTHREGTLFLAHIEDDAVLERYLEVIGRVREIDSATAAEELPAKLLEPPIHYIESIIEVLEQHRIDETVVPIVRMGHASSDYVRVVEEHDIELVIFHTKDEQQLAMGGIAHALAVEIRHRPLLML